MIPSWKVGYSPVSYWPNIEALIVEQQALANAKEWWFMAQPSSYWKVTPEHEAKFTSYEEQSWHWLFIWAGAPSPKPLGDV